MKILVVGGGGREHALAWALRRSSPTLEILVAPGNAGTLGHARNVPISATDSRALVRFAFDEAVDLVVVGPEQPLVLGLADDLSSVGIPVVGPSAAAARLEGSKAFAKDFMERYSIPTAGYRTFSRADADAARRYLADQPERVVIKASGLAAGKGAVVCSTRPEAKFALEEMLVGDGFGDAAAEVVIEEYMEGEEASVFALVDGTDFVVLAPAQDHKRIGEGDTGPNTGGMGAYAPAPIVTDRIMQIVRKQIIEPTVEGMARDGHPYRGFLYVGLMISGEDVRVVEYNCRLGDPEAQVVLPLVDGDVADLLMAQATGRLANTTVLSKDSAAACVVLASAGYPGEYENGFEIKGVETLDGREDIVVFHAGTRRDADDVLRTSGGRVLAVTGVGADLASALKTAYDGVEAIHFEGHYYRRDIGQRGLAHMIAQP